MELPMRIGFRLLALAVAIALLSGAGAVAQTPSVIHVGLAPFEGQAGPYYAQDLGLFKAAGLDVEIQPYNGGAAVVSAIAGGSLQIGGGTPLPLAQARSRGIKVVIIAPGYIYDYKAPSLINALTVSVNSPLHNAKDLTGKTIGVTALRGLDEIAIDSWLDKNGGDSKSVKFTELPQSAMADAVAAGRVDAAQMGDPGLQAAIDAGKVRVLAKSYDAISKRLFGSVWFASEDWATKNPETVHKFAAAINAAAAWATRNPVAAAAVLRKYLKVDYASAHEYHARSLDIDMIQPMLDAALKYKLLSTPVTANELIFKG
jgi:NitT/TauT family transport system substrate-binding protein